MKLPVDFKQKVAYLNAKGKNYFARIGRGYVTVERRNTECMNE